MAERHGSVRRKTRKEPASFRTKTWCFIFGHDPEAWELNEEHRLDPPLLLGGDLVSEVIGISSETFCRRCGKLESGGGV